MRAVSVIPVALAALLLTGCVTSHGEPQTVGPDTFMLSERAMGQDEAQGAALVDAGQYCARAGKQFILVSTQTQHFGEPGSIGHASSVVTFRCLRAGDPGLVRPNLRPTPNVVIDRPTPNVVIDPDGHKPPPNFAW